MNFNTIKQELHKKIKKMSEDEFIKFIEELKRIYYKNKHADAYNYTLNCVDCVYRHDCTNKDLCKEYISNKLRAKKE